MRGLHVHLEAYEHCQLVYLGLLVLPCACIAHAQCSQSIYTLAVITFAEFWFC